MTNFDSNEEKYMDWYLETLLNNGYIDTYKFHYKSYSLSNKVTYSWTKPMKRVQDKQMETTVLHPHSYTPDVHIWWNETAKNLFFQNIEENEENEKLTSLFFAINNVSIWEIKGDFDFKNMTRLATLNIKWVMKEYNEYIQIVTPNKVFNATFTPERYLLTDKSFIPRKLKYKNVRTIREFKYKISK